MRKVMMLEKEAVGHVTVQSSPGFQVIDLGSNVSSTIFYFLLLQTSSLISLSLSFPMCAADIITSTS